MTIESNSFEWKLVLLRSDCMKKTFQRMMNWEQWNFFVLYAPLLPFWFWYCLRSRSFWFFSASNPTITFGGFEGEGKREMYEQLPENWIPRTLYIKARMDLAEARARISQEKLVFPFIVKPEVGMKGILFRKIDNWEQWEQYHQKMTVEYLVQDLVELPVELSVFYYRHPASSTGTVSGMIAKELLQVIGDGKSTLLQLIRTHPKASLRLEEMKQHHAAALGSVIENGTVYYLSYAGNHNRGARFTNLESEIDGSLQSLFDELSQHTSFYYGRYDIKTHSLNELRAGRNSVILEFNGCGAEPNHIYDCGMSLWKAYSVLLTHWKALFEISAYNHKNGTPYWSFRKGWNFLKEARKHFRELELLDFR